MGFCGCISLSEVSKNTMSGARSFERKKGKSCGSLSKSVRVKPRQGQEQSASKNLGARRGSSERQKLPAQRDSGHLSESSQQRVAAGSGGQSFPDSPRQNCLSRAFEIICQKDRVFPERVQQKA